MERPWTCVLAMVALVAACAPEAEQLSNRVTESRDRNSRPVEEGEGSAGCVHESVDHPVTYNGECVDTSTLVWCNEGTTTVVDCSEFDATCGLVDAEAGFYDCSGGEPSPAEDVVCGRTNDVARVQVTDTDGTEWGCQSASRQGHPSFSGEVISSHPGGFAVDSCPLDSGCAPTFVEFDAPGLALTIPLGTYVDVEMSVYSAGTNECSTLLQVTNLASWNGVPNPVFSGERLWLAVSDGALGVLPGAPFSVDVVSQGCYADESTGCSPADDFLIRFSDASLANNQMDVEMGATKVWYIESTDQAVTARNLRSYQDADCSAPLSAAFWVASDD